MGKASRIEKSAESLGRKLAEARQATGLSQVAAAEQIGKVPSYISNLEKGKYTEPSAEVLAALATLYQIAAAQLFFTIGYTELASLMASRRKRAKARHTATNHLGHARRVTSHSR